MRQSLLFFFCMHCSWRVIWFAFIFRSIFFFYACRWPKYNSYIFWTVFFLSQYNIVYIPCSFLSFRFVRSSRTCVVVAVFFYLFYQLRVHLQLNFFIIIIVIVVHWLLLLLLSFVAVYHSRVESIENYCLILLHGDMVPMLMHFNFMHAGNFVLNLLRCMRNPESIIKLWLMCYFKYCINCHNCYANASTAYFPSFHIIFSIFFLFILLLYIFIFVCAFFFLLLLLLLHRAILTCTSR